MKKIKTLAVAFLAVAIVISASACKSNTPTPSSSTATDDKSPITFTIMQPGFSALPDGVSHNPVLDQVTKDTGVTLSYVIADNAKLKVLASSNSLPDIYMNTDNLKLSITGGQAIDMTSLIDKYAPNIKSKMPITLSVSKQMYGDGTKIYGIPSSALIIDPSKPLIPQKNGQLGLYARYDIYQAVGSPKIASSDDYLTVLKQMQDYQQNKLGAKSKVYALSGFIDFGAQWPVVLGFPYSYLDYDVWTPGDAVTYNNETGEVLDSMDPNSALWQVYEWWNKAYRMGIVDPETFTENNSQFIAKLDAGTVISSPASFWQPNTKTAGNLAGVYVLPGSPMVCQITAPPNPGYSSMCWCISNNCKNTERAIKFIDYCFSDKGERVANDGIEGKDWAVISGVPQLIGQALASALNGSTDYNKQQGIMQCGLPTFDAHNNCSDGYPVVLTNSAEQIGLTATPADKNFATSLDTGKKGFTYPGQVYAQWVKDGLTKAIIGAPDDLFYYPALDTKYNAVTTACGQYMDSQYAKIIMCKDVATFAATKAATIAKMKSLGCETIVTAEQALKTTADGIMAKALAGSK